jgi:hypothetical protein
VKHIQCEILSGTTPGEHHPGEYVEPWR